MKRIFRPKRRQPSKPYCGVKHEQTDTGKIHLSSARSRSEGGLVSVVRGSLFCCRPGNPERAEGSMAECRKKFLDTGEGGFFDTEEEVLGAVKRIEDVPHPSANAVAIVVMRKLAFLTGKDDYRAEAERSLSAFAGTARSMGLHAARISAPSLHTIAGPRSRSRLRKGVHAQAARSAAASSSCSLSTARITAG